MKRILTTVALALAAFMPAAAQTKPDPDLVGLWRAEVIQYDGEDPILWREKTNPPFLKVFRPNGEYACALFYLLNNGKEFSIRPHEYGRYTLEDGVYTEMGRPTEMTVLSDSTYKQRWLNRVEHFKKLKDAPCEVEQFVLEACRLYHPPKELEETIKTNIFSTQTNKKK